MDEQTYVTASFFRPFTLPEDERTRRINQRIQLDEQLRNQGRMSHEQYMRNRDILKTKVKIFGTQVKLLFSETWRSDPIGVVVVTLLASIVTFIGIMKLFGA